MDEEQFSKALEEVAGSMKKVESLESVSSAGSLHPSSDDSSDRSYGLFTNLKEDLVEMFQHRDLHFLHLGIDGLMKDLGTSIRRGINTKDESIQNRKTLYGTNVLPSPKVKNIFKIFFEQLFEPLMIALMVFALINLFLGMLFPESHQERTYGYLDSCAILAAVIIVVSVSTINEFTKERKFRKISEVGKKVEKVQVVRDYQVMDLESSEILVGDIVMLNPGDKIPADGVLIESHGVRTDESSVSGETQLVRKNLKKDPFLISGTTVGVGQGKMMAIALGVNSSWGKIYNLVTGKKRSQTPLEERLKGMAKVIGIFGGICSMIVWFCLFFGYLSRKVYTTAYLGEERWGVEDISTSVRFLVISISVIVVAVPEGLPLAVTISLAYSVSRMMKDMNLVRHLSACETMGGVTTICSDKTGTLTLNQMRVVKTFLGFRRFHKKIPKCSDFDDTYVKILTESISVNSNANLLKDEQNVKLKWKVVGDKTEGALLLFIFSSFQANYKEIRDRIENGKRIRKMFPFSSEKKRMSTIILNSKDDVELEDQMKFRVHTKGASEIVLKLCSYYMASTGIIAPIDGKVEKKFREIISQFSKEGLRTLAIAFKNVGKEDSYFLKDQEMVESDLCMLGIVGIEDPIRENVHESVRQCQKSGIYVRMVTGDNIHTATNIAKKCGILEEGGMAITAKQFRMLNDDDIDTLIPYLQVLAQSTPTDKFKLVQKLKARGEVVAVTGDGTNDGPALRESDVGLSMGLSGTSIAREASDIVILDDDFKSIVSSVLWGRTVFENIRKFLQFQLTVNLVALFLTIVTSISTSLYGLFGRREWKDFKIPLSAVELLWINLIMDSFAALALATEAPMKHFLDRKPYGRTEKLITRNMAINILSQGVYQLIFLFFIYYWGVQCGLCANKDVCDTLLFNVFVWCQIGNEINSRRINMELDVFGIVAKFQKCKNFKLSLWWRKIRKTVAGQYRDASGCWQYVKLIFDHIFAIFSIIPMFYVIIVAEGVFQVLFVELVGPYILKNSARLNALQWFISLLIGVCCIPYGFMIRIFTILLTKLFTFLLKKMKAKRKKTKVHKLKKRPSMLFRKLKKMTIDDSIPTRELSGSSSHLHLGAARKLSQIISPLEFTRGDSRLSIPVRNEIGDV